MEKIKNLILGSGISGLTYAYFSKEDYLILEKDNTYGGYCKTFHENDFVWDYAGHFYHFKTDKLKKFFLDKVEEDQIITQEKCTKIYYKDNLIDFPFQTNIHQLPKEEFIDCLYDLFNKEEKKEYSDFLEMLYGKFGKSITEKFLKPYNEKLYATDLKKLDPNAMGRFFPYADKEQIINNMKKDKLNKEISYNNTFMYLKKGTQYFIDKIFSGLDPKKIKFDTKVVEINLDEKYVVDQNDNKYYYENLINTIPLNKAFEIVKSKKYQDEIKDVSKNMSYNKVLVFNIGFKNGSKKYKDEHWIYFPGKETNFYRVGFYNNILNKEKLSIYVEIGFSKDEKIDIEKEYEKTLESLKKVNIFDEENEVEAYNHIVMNPAYVHINEDTNKRIINILEKIVENGFYTLGRYGKWTYNSMEDSMLWAIELIDKLQK